MKRKKIIFLVGIVFFFILNYAHTKGILIRITRPIMPPVVEYLERGLEEHPEAEFIILQIDTPGGLVTSAERMVKLLLKVKKPVIAFVYPPGGTAASAGAFLALTADHLVMSSGTRIGAAHPVSFVKKLSEDKVMEEKVTNDLLAMLKGILHEKKKEKLYPLVEEMVKKSSSFSVEEAIKNGLAEEKINSWRELEIYLKKLPKLKGKDTSFELVPMNIKERFLSTILTPDIAFMLLSLGSMGILIELYTPTVGLAGVVGAISLMLGLYALSILPVSYTGMLFILLGILFFVLELKGLGGGILALGGTGSLLLGAIYLFPYSIMGYALSVSWKALIFTALIILFFFLVIVKKVVEAQKRPLYHDRNALVGKEAEAIVDFTGKKGIVKIDGEEWGAINQEEEGIKKGESVIIIGVKGNFLIVGKRKGE